MKLIQFSQPPLFKFCPPEYDITTGCNTLRVGTLWGFRSEENDHLRDEGEGTFEYRIAFPKPTHVSRDWISEFEVEDSGKAHIEHLSFNNGSVSTTGITLSGSSHNCWIFCVSTSGNAAGNISTTHENKWKIPAEKVQEFGSLLASLLWESITFDDLPKSLVDRHSIQQISSGLGLEAVFRNVDYVDREILINSENDFPIERIRELKRSIPFIKPKKFCSEQEFKAFLI